MATLVNYTCKSLLIDPRSESPNENTSKNLLPYFGPCTQLEKYSQGRTVRSLINSSVNFTWRFSGDVASIEFGFKTTNAATIETNGKILVLNTLRKTGYLHQSYTGRVSGSRTGNSSAFQRLQFWRAMIKRASRFLADK